LQVQTALNNLLTLFKLPETQKIISNLTRDQIAGLNAGWKNIKAGFEAQFTTPSLRTVGAFIPFFTKQQNVLTDVTSKQVVEKMRSLLPSVKEINEFITWTTSNLTPAQQSRLSRTKLILYRNALPTDADYAKISKYTIKRQEQILNMIPASCQIKSEFERIFANLKAGGNPDEMVALISSVDDMDINTMSGISGEANKGKGLKLGKGIIVEKEPKYSHFGTFTINQNKLRDGVLQIKYQSGAYVFPQQKISEALSEWLLSFLEEGKPSKSLYTTVPADEKIFIERVLHKAGIFSKMMGMGWKPTKDVSADEDERRFEILKGIRGAGNDNPKLREEMKALLLKFHKQGRISKQKLGEILFDLA